MRKNRLDPYKDAIEEMLGMGMSYTQIEDELLMKYDIETCESSLSNFARKHGIKNKWREYIENVSRCESCEHCIKVVKAEKDGLAKVCLSEKRVIRDWVQTSPEWCPYREE